MQPEIASPMTGMCSIIALKSHLIDSSIFFSSSRDGLLTCDQTWFIIFYILLNLTNNNNSLIKVSFIST